MICVAAGKKKDSGLFSLNIFPKNALFHMINFCHFNTGSGWFLDKIVIKHKEGKEAQEVVFPCNRYATHGEKEFVTLLST